MSTIDVVVGLPSPDKAYKGENNAKHSKEHGSDDVV
jgi:hypothetical protein